MPGYKERAISLEEMGIPDYQTYLDGKLWKTIRKKVLYRSRHVCEVCKINKASEVHHKSYSLITMRGERLEDLVAICHDCHEHCKFEGEKKLPLDVANSRMRKMTRTTPPETKPKKPTKKERNRAVLQSLVSRVEILEKENAKMREMIVALEDSLTQLKSDYEDRHR